MTSITIVSRAAILLLLLVAANLYAADYYLKIEGVKGESKDQIIRCPDGSCTVDLASGDFTVTLCDEKGNALPQGKAKLEVYFNPKEFAVGKGTQTVNVAAEGNVVSPRDVATGQSSGKRTHKPVKIIKEWEASSPQLKLKTPTGGDHTSVIRWSLEVRVDHIKMK